MTPWEVAEDPIRDKLREHKGTIPLWWWIRYEFRSRRKRIRDEWPRPIAFRIPAKMVYWVLIRAIGETAAKMQPDTEVGLISPMAILEYWAKKSRMK